LLLYVVAALLLCCAIGCGICLPCDCYCVGELTVLLITFVFIRCLSNNSLSTLFQRNDWLCCLVGTSTIDLLLTSVNITALLRCYSAAVNCCCLTK
jgi:hypothetical protein